MFGIDRPDNLPISHGAAHNGQPLRERARLAPLPAICATVSISH